MAAQSPPASLKKAFPESPTCQSPASSTAAAEAPAGTWDGHVLHTCLLFHLTNGSCSEGQIQKEPTTSQFSICHLPWAFW